MSGKHEKYQESSNSRKEKKGKKKMKKIDRVLAVLEKERDNLHRVHKMLERDMEDSKLLEECTGEIMAINSVIWMITDKEYLKSMEDIYLD